MIWPNKNADGSPRISVDIDLTFLPVADRDTSLAAVRDGLDRIAERLTTRLELKVERKLLEDGKRLVVSQGQATIKIEVSPVLRGTVFEPELRAVSQAVEERFGFAEVQLVSFADLYAGKIAAALAWLEENEEGILDDWPRVPLPADLAALEHSAQIGRRVADLLDPSRPVDGVTSGTIRAALRPIAVLERVDGGAAAGDDFAMTARWGARDARGAVMPGPGKVEERPYGATELSDPQDAPTLGTETRDIFLNDQLFWRNVPSEIWDFTIGGFQVLKKWLSYRAHAVIDRPLSLEEVNYFRETARRLAALRLMAVELDENYRACADDSWPWRITAADDGS